LSKEKVVCVGKYHSGVLFWKGEVMLQKKALMLILMLVILGYSIGCEKKHKTKEEYYPNGKLKAVFTYNSAGMLDGVVKTYYENGKLQSEDTYKNDVPEGIVKIYYESGKLQIENNFKNGKQDGIKKYYYESGKLKAEENYSNDKLLSETCYDESENKITCPKKK